MSINDRIVENATLRTSPEVLSWGDIPVASITHLGKQVWCSDYPGPQGYGVELICTGTRWRPVSQQHCLINYHNGTTGLVVAAGAAEALYGVARLIKGGMLKPGDRLRFNAEVQQAAASDSGARIFRVRSAETEAGLLAGSISLIGINTSSTSTIGYVFDKPSIILTNTEGKSPAVGQVGGSAAGTALADTAYMALSADSYMQFTAQNLSNQALTIFASTIFVEFGS